jgi:hypothetical protein
MDASTVVLGNGPPEPGDFTTCIECGAFLTYDQNLKITLAGIDELAGLLEEHPEAFHTLVRASQLVKGHQRTKEWN